MIKITITQPTLNIAANEGKSFDSFLVLNNSINLVLNRLEQNRKSAKKCRMKKKAEFKEMSKGVS